MREVLKIKVFGITVDDTMISNRFTKNFSDDIKRHNILKKFFLTSPENSCRIWDKNGKTYIFDGWRNEDYKNHFYKSL